MRHDDQRPQLIGFAAEAPVPGYGIDVLAQMRANPLTRVRIDEFRAEAAHIVIVAPSAKVVDACFSEVLGAVRNRDSVPESPPDVPARSVENLHPGPGVEVLSPDRLTVEAIADVPGGGDVGVPAPPARRVDGPRSRLGEAASVAGQGEHDAAEECPAHPHRVRGELVAVGRVATLWRRPRLPRGRAHQLGERLGAGRRLGGLRAKRLRAPWKLRSSLQAADLLRPPSAAAGPSSRLKRRTPRGSQVRPVEPHRQR